MSAAVNDEGDDDDAIAIAEGQTMEAAKEGGAACSDAAGSTE